ncbi:hypothetical protein WMY93_022645 [Mugilogobius chulae]|uniref:Uncharacterized protein n=1 Tax=Mugilogobius chulae TaxID=88201 RepID=A0AAW0NAM3_9GOBI
MSSEDQKKKKKTSEECRQEKLEQALKRSLEAIKKLQKLNEKKIDDPMVHYRLEPQRSLQESAKCSGGLHLIWRGTFLSNARRPRPQFLPVQRAPNGSHDSDGSLRRTVNHGFNGSFREQLEQGMIPRVENRRAPEGMEERNQKEGHHQKKGDRREGSKECKRQGWNTEDLQGCQWKETQEYARLEETVEPTTPEETQERAQVEEIVEPAVEDQGSITGIPTVPTDRVQDRRLERRWERRRREDTIDRREHERGMHERNQDQLGIQERPSEQREGIQEGARARENHGMQASQQAEFKI